MLISKENRKAIHQYLFQEGVLVAKKDYNLAKHPEINVPNLEVIKALQSLNSKGFVKTQFSWQYYYYSLTNEGIEYLRGYLHLPVEIVPRTFLKSASTGIKPSSGDRRREGGDRPPRGPGGDYKARGDGEYRRRDDASGKKGDAPTGDFKPEFRGGIGRGAAKPE